MTLVSYIQGPSLISGQVSLVRPKNNSGHLMHGGLVDDEGLDYDELRHGPTGRSDCSPQKDRLNRIDRSSLRKDIN